MGIIYFVIGILLFIGLVIFHEFGHYIFAKRNKIEVEEFGLGFPPKAKTLGIRKGTEFTLNWLPLGGFVKLKGEHDADTTKGSFGAASTWAKVQVMVAGVIMNLVAAFALFTLVALLGMPKLLNNQYTVSSDTKIIREVENKGQVNVGAVTDGSPAQNAGIKVDDEIVSIAGVAIDKPEELSNLTEQNKGKVVNVVIKSDGKEISKTFELRSESPYMGVAPYSNEEGFEVRRSTWSAPIVAAGVMKDYAVATLKGLGSAIKGLGSILAGTVTGNSDARESGQSQASSQVAGPVGIFSVLYQIAFEGFSLVLFIVAIISLTLAIMNILPIPALDGGRLFVTLLFRVIKKPLTQNIEEKIHGTGFAVLMLLFLIITVVDLRRVL